MLKSTVCLSVGSLRPQYHSLCSLSPCQPACPKGPNPAQVMFWRLSNTEGCAWAAGERLSIDAWPSDVIFFWFFEKIFEDSMFLLFFLLRRLGNPCFKEMRWRETHMWTLWNPSERWRMRVRGWTRAVEDDIARRHVVPSGSSVTRVREPLCTGYNFEPDVSGRRVSTLFNTRIGTQF